MFTNPIAILTTCPICGESYEITVEFADYLDWQSGELVQNAFPYLFPEEREMLLSGICPECWERVFGE